jgi:hypothetical protein
MASGSILPFGDEKTGVIAIGYRASRSPPRLSETLLASCGFPALTYS